MMSGTCIACSAMAGGCGSSASAKRVSSAVPIEMLLGPKLKS